MATTRLIPIHAGKGRSIAETLGRTTDYVENPDKTEGGKLISSYGCNPAIAQQEFLFSKRQYAAATGRDTKESDVIAYHLRQSFKPGEIDPATANKIGYDLAMSLTKGKHAFIVCTHVDRKHIHSHIIFNSTSLDCTRKFRNFWNSSFAIRRLSDILCLENGLSVIENPKPSRGSYGTWLGDKKAPTVRQQLEQIIDTVLVTGCKDFDSFLSAMKAKNVEVKRGKHLAFRIPGGKRFIRCDSLSMDYTESAILERIAGKRVVSKKAKNAHAPATPKMLIDIQSRMQQARSPGFEHWAKIVNLKEMAKTLVYLQERNLTDIKLLEKACDDAEKKFDDLTERSKTNTKRKEQISEMQRNIGTYSKTYDVYIQYKRLPPKKKNKFYNEHYSDIISCEAAKRYFDSLKLTTLPSIQSLKQEYAKLDAENKRIYPQLKQARSEMLELLTVKNNVERILDLDKKQAIQQRHRGYER